LWPPRDGHRGTESTEESEISIASEEAGLQAGACRLERIDCAKTGAAAARNSGNG